MSHEKVMVERRPGVGRTPSSNKTRERLAKKSTTNIVKIVMRQTGTFPRGTNGREALVALHHETTTRSIRSPSAFVSNRRTSNQFASVKRMRLQTIGEGRRSAESLSLEVWYLSCERAICVRTSSSLSSLIRVHLVTLDCDSFALVYPLHLPADTDKRCLLWRSRISSQIRRFSRNISRSY